MTSTLPISTIEDSKKLRTKTILKNIGDIHLYFKEINTITGLAHYEGYIGPYTIKGIVDTKAYQHRYEFHEQISKLDWWRLSIEITISGTLIFRMLIDNGVILV